MTKTATTLNDDAHYPSKEEFLDLLANDPEFAATLRRNYEMVLALPQTPETASLQEFAKNALARLHEEESLRAGHLLLKRAMDLMEAPLEGPPSRTLAVLNELFSDASDLFLDLPEPHRTEVMVAVTGLRSRLQHLLNR